MERRKGGGWKKGELLHDEGKLWSVANFFFHPFFVCAQVCVCARESACVARATATVSSFFAHIPVVSPEYGQLMTHNHKSGSPPEDNQCP